VLPQGQITTIIGANGAGKSTLLNAIAGILPMSGTLELFGNNVQKLSVEQRVQQGLVLIPEKRELFASMTVEENLILGGYTQRSRSAETLERIFADFPRLKERRQQEAKTLSGGERQMLATGRALMAHPNVLLLDEPSLGLAPLVVKEILEIVVRLKQGGASILLVEQNARAALRIRDQRASRAAIVSVAVSLLSRPQIKG
jgi:branched-chain amino acid transport system ATP-binding protein